MYLCVKKFIIGKDLAFLRSIGSSGSMGLLGKSISIETSFYGFFLPRIV